MSDFRQIEEQLDDARDQLREAQARIAALTAAHARVLTWAKAERDFWEGQNLARHVQMMHVVGELEAALAPPEGTDTGRSTKKL